MGFKITKEQGLAILGMGLTIATAVLNGKKEKAEKEALKESIKTDILKDLTTKKD